MSSFLNSTLRWAAILMPLVGMLVAAQLPAQAGCGGQWGPNLLSQGDLGSGPSPVGPDDPFLSPDLTYSNSSLAEGNYMLTSSSDAVDSNPCWTVTGDNSSDPQGYFLLARTSGQAAVLYERTLEVCDGITYFFSAELINLGGASCGVSDTPEIEFLLNGQFLQSINTLSEGANWQTFNTDLEIEAGTDLVTIAIRYATAGVPGQVIGLDNLSFRHCGPVLELPAESIFCAGDGLVLSAPTDLPGYENPVYQWQRSFDGGNSWQDVAGAQAADLYVNDPIDGLHYRVLAANGAVNFLNDNCRVVSNATILREQQAVSFYQTPTICAGDTLLVGNDQLSEAGEYLSVLTAGNGCDSLVYTYLFTHASYDQVYSVSLCPGESFRGQAYYSSTSFEEFFTTTEGCDSLIRYEIEVAGEDVLAISGNTTLCEGGHTSLAAPAAYLSYAWSTGEDRPEIAVTNAGTYGLTVVNSAGCELSTSIEVRQSELFFIAESIDPSCPESTDGEIEVMLVDGGSAPYEYRLNEEEWGSSPLLDGLSAGLHHVAVRDANGCEVEQELELTEAAALSFIWSGLPAEPVDMGDTVMLEAVAQADQLSFRWSGDGLFGCRDCPQSTWVPLGNGRLQLEVNSPAGCSTQVDTVIELRDRFRVYLPNAFSPNGDDHNDTFFPGLGSNVQRVLAWEIYDRWGGRLFAAENRPPDDPALAWDGSWRGQQLDAGYYLYRAEIEFVNGRSKVFAGEVYLMK